MFGALAGRGEDDVAGFTVLTGTRAALFDDDVLAVGVMGAGLLGGGLAFGDAAGEVGRGFGGEGGGLNAGC